MKAHHINNREYDPKALLEMAAIFGSDFSIDWMIELSGIKASSMLPFLENEKEKGVLVRRDLSTYGFADETKREEIVGAMAPEAKASLHKKIFTFLSEELPDDDKLKFLTPHILYCSNDVESSRLLMKVGDVYLSDFQIKDALKCYYKVIRNTLSQKSPASDNLFIEATLKYSKVSSTRTLNQDTEEVTSFLKKAILRAKNLDNQISNALLHMHLAKTEWLGQHFGSAVTNFQTGLSISQKIESLEALRPVHTFIPFFYFYQGFIKNAINAYEQYAPGVEQYPKGKFSLLSTMTVGLCYVYVGMVSHGLGILNEIRELLEKDGDDYLKCNINSAIGEALLTIEKTDDAIPFLEKSLKEADRSKNKYISEIQKLQLAHAYLINEDTQRSVEYLRSYLVNHGLYEFTLLQSRHLLKLAWEMEQGRYPKIPGLSLEKEVHRMMHHKNVFSKGLAYFYRALLLGRDKKPRRLVEASLKASIHCFEKSGHQIAYAHALFELARHYQREDSNRDKLEKLVEKAAEILTPIDVDLIPADMRALMGHPPRQQDSFEEILKIGNEITRIKTQKELALKIITSVNRITGAERGAIFLLDTKHRRSSDDIKLKASRNITLEEISHPRFKSTIRLIKQVAKTGEGMIVRRDKDDDRKMDSGESIASRICVPMKMGDNVVGILYHDIRHISTGFKTSDMKILTYFASLAAIAMSHAASYEKIKRLNQKLEEQNVFYKEQQQQVAVSSEIIGESPAMQQLNAQIQQVAKTDATVLILGETGVGKELVAQTIHQLSDRAEKPFIDFQCSAMPETLISSELFGHERGAFTGATSRRIGRFELADGGTIFLDEIGTLPLDIQIHLLRVLTTKQFERVGGTVTIRSDFRLLTATNVNLDEQVKMNNFRADLYYRLNIFPIRVPPLRERIEDVPLLANHFLKKLGNRRRKFFNKLSRSQLNALMEYDWPGNVRELENVIERGAILSNGPTFELPERIRPVCQDSRNCVSLAENEKNHILWALNKQNWKVSGPDGTAELLSIHPSTLISRMKKLGIKRPATNRTRTERRWGRLHASASSGLIIRVGHLTDVIHRDILQNP